MQGTKESTVVEEPFYTAAERLEQALGDPSASNRPDTPDEQPNKRVSPPAPASFEMSVELDEHEEFPESFCHALDAWGLQELSSVDLRVSILSGEMKGNSCRCLRA